ncbi:MAG: hypothetical protein JWM04_2863 [Verrucomicrobiales bacterium]|nr:hypothetical protein [Verrucomicrobiales bacterium]
MLAASAGALLTGTSAFANHEVYVDSSETRMAHPSAELRTDTRSSIYDPSGSEIQVYHRDSNSSGLSAGFNSDLSMNADIDAQADRILRMYQKGKMPAEITDREFHQVNGQTLFPRFQASRGDYDSIHTDRYHHASLRSDTMMEPAGASVAVSSSSDHDLNRDASSSITVAPSVTSSTTNDWQKGYFNSQSNRGAEIKDPAGADISVRATQSPDLAPSAGINSSTTTGLSTDSSATSGAIVSNPSVTVSQDNSLSSTNSQLGGINNQNKDSSRLGDKNSSNRVNENSSSLNTSTSSDSELKSSSDSSATGGINNQTKDSQKSNGNDSTFQGESK